MADGTSGSQRSLSTGERGLVIGLVLAAVLLLLGGCEGCEGEVVTEGLDVGADGATDGWVDTDEEPVDSGDDAADTDEGADETGTDADGGADVDAGCGDSSVMCGGTCCMPGDECVEGQCMPPCQGTRCGDNKQLCCTGQDLCLGAQCVTPGDSCQRTEECKVDEICEPTVGKCIPRDSVEVCQYKPPTGKFTPKRECRWQPAQSDPYPGRGETEAAPTVVNVTDDNGDGKTDADDIPDLVFLSDEHADGCCNNPSTIRIVDGRCNQDGTMTTLGSISQPVTESSGGLAVGDLTGNGVPEIAGITRINGREQGVAVWERTRPDGSKWKLLWHNKTYPTWNKHTRGGGLISIADLEADGNPEIIVGNVALNGQTGKLKWDGLKKTNGNGGIGNNAFLGPSSAVADVDLDGDREVAAGNTLYDYDGTPLWTYNYTSSNSGCQGALPCDGFTAFADFDGDPEGEVVIVRRGEVFIINHDGTLHWKAKILKDDCQRGNESGPPTVADFDGDGEPEIGTAAADFYTVLDPECDADPVPQKCRQKKILWATPNEDCSSRATASSVFDFEGDGKAEMVYADEDNFYILDGTTGKILYRDKDHRSNTRIEMPVVVDVDNDGNSEVVTPAPYGPNSGISIWSDSDDNWVRTRRIWNQHGYSVTNVEEDGTIPTKPQPNWSNGRLNNYRQNQQPGGVFDAPDLVIDGIKAGSDSCIGGRSISVEVTVLNDGALGVPPGTRVDVASRHNMNTQTIKQLQTTRRLLPGQTETLTFDWTPPSGYVQDGFELLATVDPDMAVNECKEMNNRSRLDSKSITLVDTPDLIVDQVSAVDNNCPQTGKIDIEATVKNDGMADVQKGVPVVLEAVGGPQSFNITTEQTSGVLKPGDAETFSLRWRVPSQLINQQFSIEATIDPNQTVFKCSKTNQGSSPAECDLGG